MKRGDCLIARPMRLVPLLLLGVAADARIEAQSPPSWEIGLGGILGRPQGPAKEHLGSDAFGGAVEVGYRLRKAPLLLGIGFGTLDYSSFRWPPSPYVEFPPTTRAQTSFSHFVVRIQAAGGVVRPYVDARLGINQPRATTTRWTGGIFGASYHSEFQDTGLGYGGGAGLMIRFLNRLSKQKGLRAASIDLGMHYLSGTDVRYIEQDSLHLDEDGLAFDLVTADPQMLTAGIGVRFEF